ncbi:MAG: hypothetical protein JWQ22_296 [Devosia sp.]|nr:hypothetical protein [Devosia sp.]
MSSEGDLLSEARDRGTLAKPPNSNRPARASVRFTWRSAHFQADAEITPVGLLAIGGMVGAILLAVAPIVAAARVKRSR